jgi:peptidyl-tRNA hydrolase, PTH1 family
MIKIPFLKYLFSKKEEIEHTPMKYMIVGLGNIGSDYEGTRHNVGFDVVDQIAKELGGTWESDTYAFFTEVKVKGRILLLIKPTTYMNLSGKAVRHWMNKHKIPKENILIVLDDLNIDFGTLRMRQKGSDGGHNGLKDIDQTLGGSDYSRLRVGIGNSFSKGKQINFVLGKWSKDETSGLITVLDQAAQACIGYATIGAKFTMEKFNKNVLES